MDSWMYLTLILVGSLSSSIAQDGRCSKTISRVTFYSETFSKSSTQTYYQKCGFLNILTCTRYRTVYSIATRRPSKIGYVTGYECCPGWITDGPNCLPTQPPTTEVITTTQPSTTQKATTTLPTTRTTTPPPTTTQSTTSPDSNNNNNNANAHNRNSASSSTTYDSDFAPTPDYVGGQRESSSLLANQKMMMGISVVAAIVFLAMSIGGVVCGVRRLCPKKKPSTGRLENESPTRRGSEAGFQVNDTVVNGASGHGARPKPPKKATVHKGKITAASNPGYDMMDPDRFAQESSYEAIEEGPLKHSKSPMDSKGLECVRMSDIKPSPMIRLQTSPGKDRRPSAPAVLTENEYTTFREDIRTSPEPPPHRNIPARDNSHLAIAESNIGLRKPLPKPKPLPNARRNLSSGPCAPPSAGNHLVAPTPVKAQYLDMSKGQTTPSPPSVRNGEAAKNPVLKKLSSFDESPKASTEDCSQGVRSNIGLFNGNANLYDHVGESRSEPSSRRGSDAKHVFPAQGMYVQPGEVSPVVPKKSKPVNNDKMTCTYVVGDQVPGLPPRSPLFSDSYDLVGITGSSDLDIPSMSANEPNPYDLVVTPENRRKMLKPVVTKSGYATPRQDSLESHDGLYENQRRSTASLPNSNRKMSLPVQCYGDEEVYDIVEVKDSQSRTTGRPPKVAPKKPVSTVGRETQKAKAAIERSRSGPSLLRYAELDSVYVNTSRF